MTNSAKTQLISEAPFIHAVHRPLPQEKLDVAVIRTACKRKASADLCQKPVKIIHQTLREDSNKDSTIGIGDIKQICKSIYHKQRSQLPTVPKSHQEALLQMSSNQLCLSTNQNEQFCFVDSNCGIIVFTCASNLQFLCNHQDTVLADGTFYVCPKHFYQVYTIRLYKSQLCASGFLFITRKNV